MTSYVRLRNLSQNKYTQLFGMSTVVDFFFNLIQPIFVYRNHFIVHTAINQALNVFRQLAQFVS